MRLSLWKNKTMLIHELLRFTNYSEHKNMLSEPGISEMLVRDRGLGTGILF